MKRAAIALLFAVAWLCSFARYRNRTVARQAAALAARPRVR